MDSVKVKIGSKGGWARPASSRFTPPSPHSANVPRLRPLENYIRFKFWPYTALNDTAFSLRLHTSAGSIRDIQVLSNESNTLNPAGAQLSILLTVGYTHLCPSREISMTIRAILTALTRARCSPHHLRHPEGRGTHEIPRLTRVPCSNQSLG